MRKTMKMSSFLLTIGLVCMGLYVLLNMFGFGSVVEGMTKGPDAKQKQEWDEALEDRYEGLAKEEEKRQAELENFNNRHWKQKAESEKFKEARIDMLKFKRLITKNYATWYFNNYNSPDGLNKKGNQLVESIRNLDYYIKLLEEDDTGVDTGVSGGGTNKSVTSSTFGF